MFGPSCSVILRLSTSQGTGCARARAIAALSSERSRSPTVIVIVIALTCSQPSPAQRKVKLWSLPKVQRCCPENWRHRQAADVGATPDQHFYAQSARLSCARLGAPRRLRAARIRASSAGGPELLTLYPENATRRHAPIHHTGNATSMG